MTNREYEFTKFDGDKPRVSLIPKGTLLEIAAVLTMGAKKYGDHNWKKGTVEDRDRVVSAMYRHLFAHENGQELDEESGLSHLAHAATNILFLMHLTKGE